MNLKLNNEIAGSPRLSTAAPSVATKREALSKVKEERQRNGRYIAILVGICLFLLAMYHAWVRRIPVIASLVVPALIMFLYVGWVLYTASRDKYRMMDAEAALSDEAAEAAQSAIELNDTPEPAIPDLQYTVQHVENQHNDVPNIAKAILYKGAFNMNDNPKVAPIILINGFPPDDDEAVNNVTSTSAANETATLYDSTSRYNLRRKKFKRRFCRNKRGGIFKRSYSIG